VNIADWITVGEGDGMYNKVDPNDSRWLINSREFGSHRRIDQTLRTMTDIMPRRPKGEPPLRWNWTPPIALSPHNGAIVYTGAQVLLRSLNRGDTWQEISPDLTTNETAKTFGRGNIQHCTLTTVSESPVTAGVIWVGADDGTVQVTKNHGGAWTNVTAAIAKAGGPADRWVSRVLASPHEAGTAFVAKTGFRMDDFTPYLFKTTDYGATWTPIVTGLPQQPVNVVWQDRVNKRLLFAGTDKGVFVSLDGGGRWVAMKGDMPNVPVHDLHVQAREQDLVVGTYGRAIFITNVAWLQQATDAVLGESVHLFDIRSRKLFHTSGWGNYEFYGDRYHPTPNEPAGLAIQYYLREAGAKKVAVTVTDTAGKVVRTATGTTLQGLNTVTWDMRTNDRRTAPVGDYSVTLDVDGQKITKTARVRQ
jgi:hypothetical protein